MGAGTPATTRSKGRSWRLIQDVPCSEREAALDGGGVAGREAGDPAAVVYHDVQSEAQPGVGGDLAQRLLERIAVEPAEPDGRLVQEDGVVVPRRWFRVRRSRSPPP